MTLHLGVTATQERLYRCKGAQLHRCTDAQIRRLLWLARVWTYRRCNSYSRFSTATTPTPDSPLQLLLLPILYCNYSYSRSAPSRDPSREYLFACSHLYSVVCDDEPLPMSCFPVHEGAGHLLPPPPPAPSSAAYSSDLHAIFLTRKCTVS
jgi:hypothetical protein